MKTYGIGKGPSRKKASPGAAAELVQISMVQVDFCLWFMRRDARAFLTIVGDSPSSMLYIALEYSVLYAKQKFSMI